MPRNTIQGLLSDLHERFGDDLSSPQQQQLLNTLNRQLTTDSDLADPSFKETLDLLVEDLEVEHPQAAAVLREIMAVLNNMGI